MRLVSVYYEDFFPFNHLPFEEGVASNNPDALKEGDVVLVWGGGDISPSLYNKPASRYSGAYEEGPSRRDQVEWAMMKRAKEMGLPIIGVCRGAQMLCALAGGFLLQDVNNHGGYHTVTTPDGYEFQTNSIHHQMMYPFDVPHEMLASIKPPRATRHYDVNDVIPINEEPEFVYFPEVKGFAVQWHPEAMDHNCPATKFIFREFEKRIG